MYKVGQLLQMEDGEEVSSDYINLPLSALEPVNQMPKVNGCMRMLRQFAQDKVQTMARNDLVGLMKRCNPDNFSMGNLKFCLEHCHEWPAEAKQFAPKLLITVIQVMVAKAG